MTPAKVKRLLEALRVGAARTGACQYAGIGLRTLMDWLAEGRRDRAADVDSECRDMLDQVEDAEASCIVGSLGTIVKSAQAGNWQAAAWLLERRRPLQYAKGPKRLEHETKKEAAREAARAGAEGSSVEDALTSILDQLSDEAAQELLEALQKRRDAEGTS